MVDHDAMNAKKNAPHWIRQLKPMGQWSDKTSAPINSNQRQSAHGIVATPRGRVWRKFLIRIHAQRFLTGKRVSKAPCFHGNEVSCK
jgi:hypothetical protein